MALDPRIILAGQGPNVMNALSQGQVAGARQNQINQQNALANLYRTQGADIMAGDQNALNALAGIDPNAALGVQKDRLGMDATRQGMAHADERLKMARASAQRAAESHVAQMSAHERQMEADKLDKALAGATQIQTAEQFDAYMDKMGLPHLKGQFENKDVLIAEALGIKDALALNNGGGTEADRELARLASIGIPRDVAIKIKEGVYKTSTDPVTRETIVVDLSTGQPVYRIDPTGGQQPAPTQEAAPQSAEAPEATRNDRAAFGLGGAVKGTINTVSDVLNLGVPYEGVQQGQADFDVMREKLMGDIANGYKRQPPSWLLKEIRELTPEAGSVRMGPDKADAKLEALERQLAEEARIVEKQLDRRLSPGTREDLESQLSGHISALERIKAARARLKPEGEQQQTSSGVKWSIVE